MFKEKKTKLYKNTEGNNLLEVDIFLWYVH